MGEAAKDYGEEISGRGRKRPKTRKVRGKGKVRGPRVRTKRKGDGGRVLRPRDRYQKKGREGTRPERRGREKEPEVDPG